MPPLRRSGCWTLAAAWAGLVLPFAAQAAEVVGVDIAPSMLAEAKRNCELHGLNNVVLALSDNTLSAVPGQFDLVHTCIVIQHIEIERGLKLFDQLVTHRAGRPGRLARDLSVARSNTYKRPNKDGSQPMRRPS